MDSVDDFSFEASGSAPASHSDVLQGASGQSTRDPALGSNRLGGLPGDRYRELDLQVEGDDGTWWCFMRPAGPPSFTSGMLRELIDLRRVLHERERAPCADRPVHYFVGGSRIPGIYNLGGDLLHFVERIRAGDREGLRRYAHACIEVAYNMSSGFDLGITTIALVQGDALGGGFEGALSFNVLVAEKSAKFGLPEILFNLFPGMGAYTYIARRLDSATAERMILSGRIYTAEELHSLGLVDILAEDGQGLEAVRRYIREQGDRPPLERRPMGGHQAGGALDSELRDITDIWVDTAFQLTEADFRRMERLATAQVRRLAKAPS